MRFCLTILLVPAIALTLVAPRAAVADGPPQPFAIHVVDQQTGRGVPLVELETVNAQRFYTDSAGLVAFAEPGLMDQDVFFSIRSHGYTFPKDGFGNAGVKLHVRPGGSAEVKIKRVNIAERLYRITGEGIYRDSVLLGRPTPLRRPVLDGRVLGQDSAIAVPWRDKIYWFWGDTNLPQYPLGMFKTSGATSQLPGRGGLDPAQGVDLEYFSDQHGSSRAMCPIEGPGAVWIDGVAAVADGPRQVLVARYARMKNLGEMLEHGLVVFDDEQNVFRKRVEFDLKDKWRCPRGHPVAYDDEGRHYLLFPMPYATVRVRAELAALADPASYEAFTCLPSGTKFAGRQTPVERAADGHVVYGWKTGVEPLDAKRERELIAADTLPAAEAHFRPHDVDSGRAVELHLGSLAWNAYRKKWITIAVETGGKSSFLGEVWYAEADTPVGPWLRAKKIVTHDRYTFYCPVHHPFFDQQDGRLIYFEGTYAETFSGAPVRTPRYDYNQIMYRLDLADPRLSLAPTTAKELRP